MEDKNIDNWFTPCYHNTTINQSNLDWNTYKRGIFMLEGVLVIAIFTVVAILVCLMVIKG